MQKEMTSEHIDSEQQYFYHQGENLSVSERSSVEDHLKVCDRCGYQYNRLQFFSEAIAVRELREHSTISLSERLRASWERILQSVQAFAGAKLEGAAVAGVFDSDTVLIKYGATEVIASFKNRLNLGEIWVYIRIVNVKKPMKPLTSLRIKHTDTSNSEILSVTKFEPSNREDDYHSLARVKIGEDIRDIIKNSDTARSKELIDSTAFEVVNEIDE